MSVTSSAEVPAQVPAVWAVLSNPSELATWVTNHVSLVGDAPTSLAEGSEYTERMKVMGMPNDIHWTVTELDPDHRVVVQANGPMGIKIQGEYTVESAAEGSRVTLAQSFSGAALFAVKSQLEREVKGVQEASLEKLRERFAAN